MYKIESASRVALINPAGAELHSLMAIGSNEEFMWSGDPAVWSGRAPILFPIVGGVKDDRFSVNGHWYKMKKHGFARFSQFSLLEQTPVRLVLGLRSSSESLVVYPWRFELKVEFELIDNELAVRYSVFNMDDSDMAFNIGSHPAFRLPLQDARIEDYQIRFDKPETLHTYSVVNALLERQARPLLDNESLIPLTADIFDHDALVFRHIKSSSITLEHRSLGPRVRVSTGHAPHLGLWAKPAAPYVCIEPWWGHADFADETGDFLAKESIQLLAAGERFDTSISIETLVAGEQPAAS